MKDDKLYLIHILECIERIQQYTANGSIEFFGDTKTQDAVMRNLHTLAESTQNEFGILWKRIFLNLKTQIKALLNKLGFRAAN